MALKAEDFLLSEEQINAINAHFAKKAKAYADAGEDPPCGVKVEFEWVPALGRFITAKFDGEAVGCDIEDPTEGPLPPGLVVEKP